MLLKIIEPAESYKATTYCMDNTIIRDLTPSNFAMYPFQTHVQISFEFMKPKVSYHSQVL
jgi:hypothetical protein